MTTRLTLLNVKLWLYGFVAIKNKTENSVLPNMHDSDGGYSTPEENRQKARQATLNLLHEKSKGGCLLHNIKRCSGNVIFKKSSAIFNDSIS